MKLNYWQYMNEAGDMGADAGGGMEPAAQDTPAKQGLMAEHNAQRNDGNEPEPQPADTHVWEQKPDWLDDQFYDADNKTINIEALQKSQRDFRNKTREKMGEVPSTAEAYSFDIPEHMNIAVDDPQLSKMRESFLSNKVPVEMAQGIMADYFTMMNEQGQADSYDAEAEREKLGANADKVIAELSDNLDSMVSIGLFSESDYNAAVEVAATADGIRMMNKLFNHYQQRPGIPIKAATEGTLSKDELDAMVGSEEYVKDPSVRRKVAEGYRKLEKAGILKS